MLIDGSESKWGYDWFDRPFYLATRRLAQIYDSLALDTCRTQTYFQDTKKVSDGENLVYSTTGVLEQHHYQHWYHYVKIKLPAVHKHCSSTKTTIRLVELYLSFSLLRKKIRCMEADIKSTAFKQQKRH